MRLELNALRIRRRTPVCYDCSDGYENEEYMSDDEVDGVGFAEVIRNECRLVCAALAHRQPSTGQGPVTDCTALDPSRVLV